jgi:hypothetical protein
VADQALVRRRTVRQRCRLVVVKGQKFEGLSTEVSDPVKQ